ncbi:MAG: DUF2190 family protein [Phycisphaera sp.]|nr:DUF2190 family protein [Phycisphaera sp.]
MTGAFVHIGDAIDYVPAADVAAGEVVLLDTLFGIARTAIPANTLGTLAVVGVFNLDKAVGAGTAIAIGKKVYWDEANKVVTTTSTGNKLLGKAVADAGDDDATILVKLTP